MIYIIDAVCNCGRQLHFSRGRKFSRKLQPHVKHSACNSALMGMPNSTQGLWAVLYIPISLISIDLQIGNDKLRKGWFTLLMLCAAVADSCISPEVGNFQGNCLLQPHVKCRACNSALMGMPNSTQGLWAVLYIPISLISIDSQIGNVTDYEVV